MDRSLHSYSLLATRMHPSLTQRFQQRSSDELDGEENNRNLLSIMSYINLPFRHILKTVGLLLAQLHSRYQQQRFCLHLNNTQQPQSLGLKQENKKQIAKTRGIYICNRALELRTRANEEFWHERGGDMPLENIHNEEDDH